MVLEQAAAIPEASVFLSPSTMAALEDVSIFDADEDEDVDDGFNLVEGEAVEGLPAPPRMLSNKGVDGAVAWLVRNGRFALVKGESIRRRLNKAVHLISDDNGKRAIVVLPDFEVLIVILFYYLGCDCDSADNRMSYGTI